MKSGGRRKGSRPWRRPSCCSPRRGTLPTTTTTTTNDNHTHNNIKYNNKQPHIIITIIIIRGTFPDRPCCSNYTPNLPTNIIPTYIA